MKIKYIIFVLTFWIALSSFTIHKYYVSVTQLDYSEKNNRIEITTRVFIDDFEKTLENKFKEKMNLATKQEHKNAEDFIQKYCNDKIKMEVNGKFNSVIFMGMEYQDDVVICYLKVTPSEKIKTIDFYNAMLTETFSDQQNLVHSSIFSQKKSFMITSKDRKASLAF